MNIEIAAVADYALIDQSGKMGLLGVFSGIGFATPFPNKHARFFFCLRLACHPIEQGTQHQLRVVVQTPDGERISEAAGGFIVPNGMAGGKPSVQAVLEFADVIFPKPGDYSIEIAIDNKHMHSVPLVISTVNGPK